MYSFGMNSTSNIENTNSANFHINSTAVSVCTKSVANSGDQCNGLNGVPTTPVPYIGSSPTGLQTIISPSDMVSANSETPIRATIRRNQAYRMRNGSNSGALTTDNSANGNTSSTATHLTREERRRRRRATQKYRLAHATRERIRVEAFNVAFSELRHLLPTLPPDKKLSKIEILRLAICYIAYLNHVLDA